MTDATLTTDETFYTGENFFTGVPVSDPWLELAIGILLQASLEAVSGDPGAIEWFESSAATLMIDAIGLEPGRVKEFISKCKPGKRLGYYERQSLRRSAREQALGIFGVEYVR